MCHFLLLCPSSLRLPLFFTCVMLIFPCCQSIVVPPLPSSKHFPAYLKWFLRVFPSDSWTISFFWYKSWQHVPLVVLGTPLYMAQVMLPSAKKCLSTQYSSSFPHSNWVFSIAMGQPWWDRSLVVLSFVPDSRWDSLIALIQQILHYVHNTDYQPKINNTSLLLCYIFWALW